MGDIERRLTARYYLVSRADVLVLGSIDPLWAGVANVSRTGVTLYIRQSLKLKAKVSVTFRFRTEDGWEMTEKATAAVVWQESEVAGLEFEHPILANSPAARTAPYLADYLAKKEADDEGE